MLKNAPTLAIGGVHPAENEPLKISLVHFISSIVSLTNSLLSDHTLLQKYISVLSILSREAFEPEAECDSAIFVVLVLDVSSENPEAQFCFK